MSLRQAFWMSTPLPSCCGLELPLAPLHSLSTATLSCLGVPLGGAFFLLGPGSPSGVLSLPGSLVLVCSGPLSQWLLGLGQHPSARGPQAPGPALMSQAEAEVALGTGHWH